MYCYSIAHYFDFNGWVFQCARVHSLPFVVNNFDFDTHFGWPMVKRSENFKIYYQSFICCVMSVFYSFSVAYGPNGINIMYACAAASALRSQHVRQMNIFRIARLFANDHHFSMCACVFAERYSFDFHNKIILNFIKTDRSKYIYI